jgi:hypothetical protein
MNSGDTKMYCIISPLNVRRITNDYRLVQAAIEMDWQVWHNGNRVW